MKRENSCLVLFLFMLQSIPLVHSTCQSTNGMNFVEHTSSMLRLLPFQSMAISYYLECLVSCDANYSCKSLNIRMIQGRMVCELLAGGTNEFSLVPQEDATYYELVMQFTADSSKNKIKTYCEPECKFAGVCRKNIPRCRCESGSIQGLQDDGAVLVKSQGDGYAALKVNVPSGRYKIKLVYNFGVFACISDFYDFLNNFGCLTNQGNRIAMVLTYKNNTRLLPGPGGYSHDGKISRSSFVTFNDAVSLEKGQTLHLWYDEDLLNDSESDNFGSVSMYVLAIKQN